MRISCWTLHSTGLGFDCHLRPILNIVFFNKNYGILLVSNDQPVRAKKQSIDPDYTKLVYSILWANIKKKNYT